MRIRTLAPTAAVVLGALLAGPAVAPATASTPQTITPVVYRIGGADRYAVSAAISADTFAAVTSVPVAYVVSGENFADALSASALAGLKGGPVLLTQKDNLPEPIRFELSRIHPVKIIVLGGTAAISDAVFAELRKFAPTTVRLDGPDRFAVSAAAAKDATGTTAPPAAFVASGENFPDALSGAAAAGHLSGPVLLTRQAAVPVPVFDELDRENPGSLKVLGGPAAIADSVVTTLAAEIQPATVRVGGKDRYEVSATISATTFGTATTVYIASGENFPDALSGAAAAITNEAPVLLVTKSSIPAPIAAELKRLNPTRIVVLGGPAAIDPSVETQLAGFLAQ